MTEPVLSVLFVCTGNYCRSPTAEGMFLAMLRAERLDGLVHVDSAGTHDYHVGEAPDPRTIAHAGRRGLDLRGLRGRQIEPGDFARFDLILVMDRVNRRDLDGVVPSEQRHKVRLMMDFAPHLGVDEVPDPYLGEAGDFERVLDLLDHALRGLLAHARARAAAGTGD
ncbi:MAG: low molecular weight phosphotyrosine protein phosphatase [Planctomycetes bacterium]|nr:low molecular weight phosphotyrosine protein phosphatase [Planctomycetota bacterium]